MFLRSGLLSSFAGIFVRGKNKRIFYVVVIGRHPRRFLSGICRYKKEKQQPFLQNKTPGNSKNSPGVLLKGVALWSSSRSVFIRDLSFRKGTTTAKTDSRLRLSGMTTL